MEGFTIRVATPEEVLATAADKPRFLPMDFASAALDKGDVCVGAFQDGQLVYYGWYSGLPTRAFETLLISVGPGCWYGYNAMTLPRLRGRGLHAAAIRFAPQFIAAYGATRLIFYVEASNEKPLLATARAGMPPYGVTFTWELGSRLFVWSTRLCREVGFQVTRIGSG